MVVSAIVKLYKAVGFLLDVLRVKSSNARPADPPNPTHIAYSMQTTLSPQEPWVHAMET